MLKIIAYTEDPHRRAKDLDDIRLVLGRYEAGSAQLFSEAVFDAKLSGFSEANAFLLGVDLRGLATEEEAAYIERFVGHFLPRDEGELDQDDFAGRAFRGRLHALAKGFNGRDSG